MGDLVESRHEAVVPYERGAIPFGDVLKGVVGRFLPASAVSLFGAVALTAAPGTPLTPLFGMFGAWVAWIGLGFGVGLFALRRWLFPDANVSGTRSVLAGALGGLMPLAIVRFGLGLTILPFSMTLTLVLVGLGMALGMFFPWLTETPPEMRDAEYAVDGAGVEHLSAGAP